MTTLDEPTPALAAPAPAWPLIVLPTYDEIDNLAEAVDRILAAVPHAEVLVVDDASPDGTGALADRISRAEPRVHVLHRSRKEGLGAAYRGGFAWALARHHDAIVEMDADLSHPADRLPALLAALGHADVAIGSRYTSGGYTVGWPVTRQLISRAGNGYVSLALRLGVRDATAGFRAYHRTVLEACDLRHVRSNGYCFQIEMTELVRQRGFRVAEVPIAFTERVAGRSKMRSRIVAEALWRVTGWGLRNLLLGRQLHPDRQRLAVDLTVTGERVVVHAA